ncbi:MAG: hypothetical protein WC364_15050 [Eubacteriales bacterium]|jgi:hypothetical protein
MGISAGAGSDIKVKGNCTNRKCEHHVPGIDPATYKQIEYIKDMLEKLHDDTKYAFRDMTQRDASKLIKELQERLEVGE